MSARIVSVTPLPVVRDSRTFKIAASIERLGYESVVVEGTPSGLGSDSLPFELLTLKGTGLRTALGAARQLPRADLYYLHSFRQYPALMLARLRSRTPYIYDAHDYYLPDIRQRCEQEGPLRRCFCIERSLRLERACLRSAALVITTTNGNAREIEKAFGRRPAVLINSHDSRLDSGDGSTVRERCGLSADAFLIVVAGNTKPGAAITKLIEAIASLPDSVHLALVGTGYESFAQEITSRGLDGRIHRLPPVPSTGYAPFISTADIALIPYFAYSDSYRYAVGNRFFVALAVGLPILYPIDLPDLVEFATRYDVGLPIDALKPETVVNAVRRLLEQDGLLQRLGANAARAAAPLSWETQEAQLGEMLTTALLER